MPSDLVSDIRAIAEICRRRAPDPLLESIENIRPVDDPGIIRQLEADLDEVLGWPDTEAAGFVAPVVPMSHMNGFLSASSLTIKIGSAQSRQVDDLDLHDFLLRTRLQEPGRRLRALRRGHVRMFADADGTESMGGSKASNWIEAALPLGPRRFFLLEDTWYEIAANYLVAMRAHIERLLCGIPPSTCPGGIWAVISGGTTSTFRTSGPGTSAWIETRYGPACMTGTGSRPATCSAPATS
jgi:uncharacterized protein (TIGR04141 family)